MARSLADTNAYRNQVWLLVLSRPNLQSDRGRPSHARGISRVHEWRLPVSRVQDLAKTMGSDKWLHCEVWTSFFKEKKGKIWKATLDIIHVIQLKTLQYLLSQILQIRWPVILDVVVCRHTNLIHKIEYFVLFSSSYIALKYNFFNKLYL